MNELDSFRSCVEQKELIDSLVSQGFISPEHGRQMIKRVFDRHFKWMEEAYADV